MSNRSSRHGSRAGASDVSRSHSWSGESRAAGWFASCAAGALLVFLSLTTLWDVDFWWQWKTGELIAQIGVIRTEPFALTREGVPRIESSWLYCLAVYRVYNALGSAGLILSKTVLVLAAFVLAALSARRLSPVRLAVVVSLAALACSQRFVVRPEVVSYAMLGLYLFALSRLQRGRRWPILVLPLAQIAWINVHSYALLGPVAVGLFIVCGAAAALGAAWSGERIRRCQPRILTRSAIVLLSVGAATLVNPYGWIMLRVPIDQLHTVLVDSRVWLWGAGGVGLLVAGATLGRRAARAFPGVCAVIRAVAAAAAFALVISAFVSGVRESAGDWIASRLPTATVGEKAVITELASPFSIDRRFLAVYYYEWMVVLFAAAVLLRPRLTFPVLFAAGLFSLSLVAVRNVPLFCIAAVPVVCDGIAGGWVWAVASRRAWARVVTGPGPRAAAACLIGSLAIFQCRQLITDRFWVRQGASFRFGLGETPHHFPRAAADFLDAHALTGRIFSTHGAGSFLVARGNRTFIDSRAVDGLIDEYRVLLADPALLASWCDAHGVMTCVIEISHAELIATMIAGDAWRLVDADPVAAVLVRAGERPDIPALRLDGSAWRTDMRRLLPPPRPYSTVGWLGQVTNPIPYHRMGRFCHAVGAHDAAEEFLHDAYAAYPPLFAASAR